MPTATKYNEDYHNDWAWSLAMKGATDEEIAEAFKISVRTLHRWKKEHPSFVDALNTGKDVADAKVEKMLYKRALGFETKDVEQYVETDPVTGTASVTKSRVVTKTVPPDTMAIMYWLNNRKKKTGEWAQRQEIDVSGNINGADLSKLSDEELRSLVKYAEEDDGENGDDEDS